MIPLVLRAARDRNASVTVFGRDYPTRDGMCVRDYVHVADLARAHVSALEVLQAGEIEHDVFNLGCGDGYTVQEVIEAAERVTDREIPIVWGPRRSGDPAVLGASAAKIQRVLGWHPVHESLDAIVSSAWRWEMASGGPITVDSAYQASPPTQDATR